MDASTPATDKRKGSPPLSVSIATLYPSIPKTLQYIEWAFLLAIVIRIGLLILNRPLAYEIGSGDYISFTVLGVLTILSFVFPLQRPMWQRQGYIFIETVVLLVSRLFTDWGLDPLLYLVLVKSCFLLQRRRDVIFTAIAAGVAWQLSLAQRTFQNISVPIEELQAQIEQTLSAPKPLIVLDLIVNSTTVYVITCLLIILMCWTVLSERRSRLEATNLSQEVKTLAIDLERTRIARDIHDSLGHTLTTLDVQLEVAQTLHDQDPEQSLQALNRAKVLSKQSLQEVRRAVSTMRHGSFNLSEALTGLIDQIQQTTQPLSIKTQINLPALPLQVSQQLFLIVKEGLTNIQKHSQASSVKLWACSTPEGVAVGLSDNGVGFNSQPSVTGYGLRGMQERVQLLGGQMIIQSVPGKGTLIQVSVPKPEA